MDWQKEKNWEPLPPRKSRKKSANASASASQQSSSSSGAAFDSIEENIAARSKINRAQTTLESRDGCSGEYYEYLDHTADVQCHVWGKDLIHAFENMAECMSNYMTDIDLIEIDPSFNMQISIKGHDLQSLLYNYMNELLFKFITDCFVVKQAKISYLNPESYELEATLFGDIFDASKHTCGTEIKAITYSNMQIHLPGDENEEKNEDGGTEAKKRDRVDLFVIVDI